MKITENFQIITHAEIEDVANTEMLQQAVREYKENTLENLPVATWSVQDESYSDDLFNGTFEEAKEAAKKFYREGADIVDIALIELNEDLCFDYCHEEVSLEELFDDEEEFEEAKKLHDENN